MTNTTEHAILLDTAPLTPAPEATGASTSAPTTRDDAQLHVESGTDHALPAAGGRQTWQKIRRPGRGRRLGPTCRLTIAQCPGLSPVLVTGFVLIDQGWSTAGAAAITMLLLLRLVRPVNELLLHELLLVVDVMQSALATPARMAGVVALPMTGSAGAVSWRNS